MGKTAHAGAALGLWLVLLACGREVVDAPGGEGAVPPVPAAIEDIPQVPAREPRDVVLISLDTLRADHLGTYGYARDTSPHLDGLARDGVVFEEAYSHSPKTAESHMSLFTSLMPEAHRVMNHRGEPTAELSPDLPTLPELLRAAGFRTAAFTSGGNVHRDKGFGRGFERYEHLSYDAAESFQGAAAWLEEQAVGTDRPPFFLFVHTYQPHDPYLSPPEYRHRYADPDYAGDILSDPEVLAAQAGDWWKRREYFWNRVDKNDPLDMQHLRDLYDGCIRYTDAHLGAFLDAMRRLDVLDDAIVIVLSDHGEEFMDHGWIEHNSVYDELLRVPLVLHLPGVRRGLRIASPARLVDVMPTLLDLLDIPAPNHLQGASLRPMLEARERGERPVFAQWREKGSYALRFGEWKLVRHGRQRALFRVSKDPREELNVRTAYPQEHARLQEEARKVVHRSRGIWDLVETGVPVEPSEETLRQLEALGYLTGDEEPRPSGEDSPR